MDSRVRKARARATRVGTALCVLVLLASLGCATTRQPRRAPAESGFLDDYSMLQPGKGEQAGLVYIAPDGNLADYDAILLDSVTVWRNSDTEKLSAEERQALTDYLYEAVHRELSKDWQMVEKPGPRTLRVRLALTEAKGAKVVANTVTSVVPQLRLIATLGGMATDTRLMVGAAAIELEITDALSDRLLAAAVDERWGTKAIRGGILKWSDVKSAFDYWAERLRKRLAEERGAA